jgi:hypothetical protein
VAITLHAPHGICKYLSSGMQTSPFKQCCLNSRRSSSAVQTAAFTRRRIVKIKVINPNTTLSMTRSIGEAARAAVSEGTIIEAVSPSMGPVSIEGHYDEALASVGVIDEVRKGEADGVDAYVLACFGDPGLMAARELATGPVIGIAQAAFHAASFAGRSFAIVTTLGPHARPRTRLGAGIRL